MSRKLNDYLVLGLKGIAMGAADVVPGVSGGTIAFISGIYEELLASIKNLPGCLPLLFKKGEGINAFWKKGNLNFLVALAAGIVAQVATTRVAAAIREGWKVMMGSVGEGGSLGELPCVPT